LVCYGGDGTAMQVAAGAVGSGIPLGIVPGGTGNLLAGNLRLPRRPAAAARAILKGKPLPLDLGSVARADGTHYFAVCCGTGFDAALMAATGSAEKRRWKMAAYVARAFAALPRVTSPLHRVTVDGVTRELPAAMVLVANCGELIPPFLKLRDDIAPDDGWLDVLALRADGTLESLAAFLELWRRPRNGRGTGRLWFGRGRTVRVEVLDGRLRPEVVILDLHLPDVGGLEVLERLRPQGASVILLTGQGDIDTAVRAMQLGAEHFLTKPVDMKHLAAATARVAEKVRLTRQNALLRARDHEGEGLDSLGVSPAMRELARQIELLAASECSTVLLAGESGTGKGWAARVAHHLSPRSR